VDILEKSTGKWLSKQWQNYSTQGHKKTPLPDSSKSVQNHKVFYFSMNLRSTFIV
jgi:hypothetical protein